MISPSPENDQLYRPVSPDDPEVVALAESIRKEGLLEPLVITTDHYLLSGHRRFVACKLAGLTRVKCQVKDVTRGEGGIAYLPLLREYNRQRVKTLDEVIREEVVSVDPEEAYRAVVEHRRKKAVVAGDLAFEIGPAKRRSRITAAKEPFLGAIIKVLQEQREFWPLTDRRIHYALLNDPPLKHASKPESTYTNDPQSYKSLTELLTRARIASLIPWEAIDDPTRPVTIWNCHGAIGSFVRSQLDGFLKDYYRNPQQSQPNHVEIVGEKNTILNIIEPVAGDHCIPVVIERGQCSSPPRKAMAERYRQSGKEKLVLLMLGDFDPDGEAIVQSFARSMRDDFHIQNVEPIKVALTHRQVREMSLPADPMPAKEDSSNYEKFVTRYGRDTYELEAVPPQPLQEILRDAIDSVLDTEAFNVEVEKEKEEAAYLGRVRCAVKELLAKSRLLDPDQAG
jgi:hypothetical protein